mgnify:CR=1 FL=1
MTRAGTIPLSDIEWIKIHFNTKVFFRKFNCFYNSEIGVSLTATWAADFTDRTKGGGCPLVKQSPRFICKRC